MWADWSTWSSWSATCSDPTTGLCGNGTQISNRTCVAGDESCNNSTADITQTQTQNCSVCGALPLPAFVIHVIRVSQRRMRSARVPQSLTVLICIRQSIPLVNTINCVSCTVLFITAHFPRARIFLKFKLHNITVEKCGAKVTFLLSSTMELY